MITKITLFVIVGIGVIVFSIFSFQEKEDTRGPVLGEASIMEVMLAFIETVSFEENENKILLRDITVEEQEILEALKLPNLERNEKMMEYGVRISTQYNQASLDYSSGSIRDNEYYTKLYNLRDYYMAYMTFTDSYIGEGDVLIQKKSMIQELIEIEEQINILRFSENIYEDGESSGFGLGLYISKKIIDAHNGNILAYNHKGYPVFEITLPIMTLNHKNKISNNIELEKITK